MSLKRPINFIPYDEWDLQDATAEEIEFVNDRFTEMRQLMLWSR